MTKETTDNSKSSSTDPMKQDSHESSENGANNAQDHKTDKSHSKEAALQKNSSTDDVNARSKSRATNTGYSEKKQHVDSEQVVHQPKKQSSVFSVAVGLLSIISIGLVGWVIYENHLQKLKLEETVKQQAQAIEKFESDINDFSQSNQQSQQAMRSVESTMNGMSNTQTLLRQQLTTTQDKLRLLSSTGKQDWVLEQINYYLALAQKKIIFEDNIQTAIALLREAQNQLKSQADLNLYQLEQAISDDITNLAALPKRNKAMLLMQLTSLEQEVEKLSPIAPQFKNVSESTTPENKEWFDALLETLNEIGESSIKYRDHSEKVQPLMTQEQTRVIKTTIQLLLTQAQSAVINSQPDYYENRLAQASKIINEFFVLDDVGGSLASKLEELAKQSFPQQVNVELKSFVVVQDLKEQKRLQWLSSQPTENNGDQE
ncbi:MAG: uroporphyrinogen-III C-methyltransferase [Gammaproteobacteria bacterium]|nr:uroporphyrinogen-III C-methyltransferase [Gammaproteobacteria bacterium]